jgi:hypothetical protein
MRLRSLAWCSHGQKRSAALHRQDWFLVRLSQQRAERLAQVVATHTMRSRRTEHSKSLPAALTSNILSSAAAAAAVLAPRVWARNLTGAAAAVAGY